MADGSFQAEAKRRGRLFESQAAIFLESLGFNLLGSRTLSQLGCEVDQLAQAPNGKLVYFEFKGSYRGNVPGMRRTDTAKKGLLTGFLLQSVGDPIPYYILTSHLPLRGSALAMVKRSIECGAVADVIEINTERAQDVLMDRFGPEKALEDVEYEDPEW